MNIMDRQIQDAGGVGLNKERDYGKTTAALLWVEGEKIDLVPNTEEGKQGVLSDAELDVLRLLDRRPEVSSERWKGWISGAGGVAQAGMDSDQDLSDVDHAAVGTGRMAVYEAPVDKYTHCNL